MKPDFVFDVCECSIEGIGCVGNLEVWVPLEGEQKWKMSAEAVVGAAETFVRVVPFSGDRIDGFFDEELFPAFVPLCKPVCEARFIRVREQTHELLQFHACGEFRCACDVARDDLCLVKVTHLDRHGKGLEEPSSPIADDCLHVPSLRGELFHTLHIPLHRLVGEERPSKISSTVGTTPDHDAEGAPEVRRVHDDHHVTGFQLPFTHLHAGELLLDPAFAPAMPLRELCVGLLALDVLFPEQTLLVTPLLTALLPAIFAAPKLPTVIGAVPFETA